MVLSIKGPILRTRRRASIGVFLRGRAEYVHHGKQIFKEDVRMFDFVKNKVIISICSASKIFDINWNMFVQFYPFLCLGIYKNMKTINVVLIIVVA